MTAYFQYKNENCLITKTKMGVEIEVLFEGTTPCEITMDGFTWCIDDDALYDMGAIVQNGMKPYEWQSLYALVKAAEDEYEEIMAEVQREADNEARHQKSMSDSGRYI